MTHGLKLAVSFRYQHVEIKKKGDSEMIWRNKLAFLLAAISSVALCTSAMATEICKFGWYQEKEPEGLAEFAKRVK